MKIILFRGRPCTGKTTLSNLFAQQTNLPILRKDDIYDASADFITEHDTCSKISYGALWKILESNILNCSAVVVDFPFQHQGELNIIKDWCDKNGVALKSILVTCSDEKLWSERLKKRAKKPRPNQKITDFESFQKLYGTMHLIPEKEELLVDTTNSIDICLKQIIDFINLC